MTAPPELVAFIERERPRLVRACHLLLDDHATAEEIAQESLLRAASRWERVGQLSSPGGWVHRVAVNRATSQLRRWQAERRAHARLRPDEHESSPDTTVAVEIRRGLSALPLKTRRLLILRYVLDWSADDIAEADGVRSDAVRQRLHRAREALRHELDPSIALEGPVDLPAAQQEASDAS